MSEVVIVLSTVPDNASAEKMARTLVEEHLVACVNLLPPMTSIYRWKGALERDTERQLVMKTTRSGVPALEKRLKELHSYEVPEFIVIAADSGSADYVGWLTAEVRK
jgi:periplasmic divalent cation tolerance protein